MFEFSLSTEIPPWQVYQLHQLVMNAMYAGGDGLNKEASRPLFRVREQQTLSGETGSILLVRASTKPLAPVGPILEQTVSFTEGETRTFHCRLSLSKRARQTATEQSKKNSREVPLAPGETDTWLQQLLARHGLALQNAAVVSRARVTVNDHHHINAADLIFHARITDANAAQQAYLRGLGRKKAFGFGLMLEAEQ